jgi:hypothetical protein
MVRVLMYGGLTLLVMVAMSEAFALRVTSGPPSSPATMAMPVVDATEHDPYDLIFDSTDLRGKIITVRAIVHCLDNAECILDLPITVDNIIYVRIEGIPPTLRHSLFDRIQMHGCAQLLTGYFTGQDLLVTEFSPTPECVPVPRSPDLRLSQLSSVGSPPFLCPKSADASLIDAGCVSESDLDAYTYENEVRYSQ